MSRRPTVRQGLLLGASLGALTLGAGAARAQDGSFVRRPVDPAAQAAAAVQAQASSANNANAIAQRTLDAFARAASARDAATNAQAAARAAAARSQAALAVPNGLGEGGLKVADGVTFDPSAITGIDDPRLSSANLWTGAKRPTQQTADGKTTVTIEQTQQKAILNWETFNIGRDTTVDFNQSAGGASAAQWIALNRITDPKAAPSQIFGSIKAQGQVYLINQNGILFGGTSKINVHTLVASSLDVAGDTLAQRNGKFVSGILFNPREAEVGALLTFGERFEGLYPRPSPFDPDPVIADDVQVKPDEVFAEGDGVTVDAGAVIEANRGGSAMLLGHNVVNNGAINSPEGQVILAAGRGVYLARNIAVNTTNFNQVFDPDLRGLIANVTRGGRADNHGIVTSDRGNVTLTGQSVLQAGFVQTTTSASLNGSITLKAAEGYQLTAYPAADLRYGDVTLASGSTTQILPDSNGEKAIGFDQYRPSKIDILGRHVTFEGGSTLFAPSADVTVAVQRGSAIFPEDIATDPVTGERLLDPNGFSYLIKPSDARVYVDKGAVINLGGLRGVAVSASQNTIQGELRANELRDNPVLRDSFLRGRTVYFDARKGTSIADLSGYYNLIERDVRELMTTGGNLRLIGAEVVTREGSTIDISGGSLNYGGGFVRSSQLVDRAGNIVRIEDARPGVEYVGFYGDTTINHERWGVTETFSSPFFRPEGRYEAGYVEGRSAGSLQLGLPSTGEINPVTTANGADDFRVIDGRVIGDIVVGQNQRERSTGATAEDVAQIWRERPEGAALTAGTNSLRGDGTGGVSGGDVAIGAFDALPDGFTSDTALDRSNAFQVNLSEDLFGGDGFTRVTLNSGERLKDDGTFTGGSLTIGEGVTVDLGDFGSLTFTGTRANIDGTIRAANGNVAINTLVTGRVDWNAIAPEDRPQINLGATGVIDVAGRWVSDFLTVTDRPALAIDGGRVALTSSNDITLAQGSLIDVSGGGQLSNDGRQVTPGDGGAIALTNNVLTVGAINLPNGPGEGNISIGGELRGFALGRGAVLTIAAARGVVISDTPVMADDVLEAGEEAATDFALVAETLFPAGSFVPVPTSITITSVPTGEPLAFDAFISFDQNAAGGPIVTEADWVLPDGFFATDENFAQSFDPGQTVPAGTRLGLVEGSLPEGAILPADVFGNREIAIRPVTSTFQPGVLDRDVTLAAGTIVPRGSRLDQSVAYQPLSNLTPDFFTEGGFSGYGVSGGGGVTVANGTTLAPTAESFVIDGLGRDIASGSKLYDVADRAILPEALAQPMRLALTTAPFDLDTRNPALQGSFVSGFTAGRVVVGDGARIVLPNESTFNALSETGVMIDGTIDAPGGGIGIEGKEIRLGARAGLLARGYLTTRVENGLTLRTVRDGGSIDLINYNRIATDVAGLITTAQGSVLDTSSVRGIADFRDLSGDVNGTGMGYAARTVDGHGGDIRISAPDGVLAGSIDLAPGGESGRGGRFAVTTGDRMTITGTTTQAVADAALASSADIDGFLITADRLNASGAHDFRLVTRAQRFTGANAIIAMDGDIALRARGSIELQGGAITGVTGNTGSVDLSADFVSLTGGDAPGDQAVDILSNDLSGRFTVRARTIDIGMPFGCGIAACVDDGIAGGFETVDLIAAGDIRLVLTSLRSAGDINLTAAQTVAATPFTDYLLESGTKVTFASNGATAPVPPIIGGRLTVRAPEIVQGGVLRSPYGEINLEASETLTLTPGSLTSISLEGTRVPLPELIGGFDGSGQFTSGVLSNATIRLNGETIDVQGGAVVDVAGGGDLSWYQFILGNGGSRNILAPEAGYLAVVPSLGDRPPATSYTPVDRDNVGGLIPNFYGTDSFTVGDQVYLEGIAGLPAGVYTLLPPEYARLDGGFLIKQTGQGGYASAPVTIGRDDGSSLVGGYKAVAGTAIRDAAYQRFEVLPQKTFTQYSVISDLSFNAYIDGRNVAAAEAVAGTNRAAARLRNANDAGSLVVAARETLVLDGDGRFGAGKNGLLGNLDITADRIAVTAGGAAAPEGFLTLDVDKLNAFGAGSLLLGGTRTTGANGTDVSVIASEIIVDTGGVALSGTEILLAANGGVTIVDGAVVSASGSGALDSNPLNLSGDGALVRASIGDRVAIQRTGASGMLGTLDIGDGARMAAAGSLSLDASGAVLLDSGTIFEAAQLDLGSLTISLGDVPSAVGGTVLSNAALALLGQSDDLLLRGFNSIDVYGDMVLGGRNGSGAASLGSVTFDTTRLQGIDGGSALVTASDVLLRNSGGALASGDAGTGAFTIDADRLILGPGEIGVAGFAGLDASAGALVGLGKGAVDVAGSVRIAAAEVTAEAGSDVALRAGGDLALVSRDGDTPAVTDFGGRFAITGQNVTVDTRVTMPAGIFEANATGVLTLGDNAALDLRGVTVNFRDVVRHASGGSVRLSAGGGVTQATGSTIDVSGDARGGHAGFIEVGAGGAVALSGTLTGTARDGFKGGGFAVDAGSLPDFSGLNAALGAGGLTGERMIAVDTGDIVLGAGETITAHDVLLKSGAGAVRVAGTINAAANAADRDGGSVRLIGGGGVDLAGTARIDARAGTTPTGGFAADSGLVEIAATGGRLNVAQGAVVDLSAGKQGGGKVIIRAVRDGNDIAIDALGGSFTGARDRGIYGMASYGAETVDAGIVDAALGDAAAWMAGADTIGARLGAAGFEVRPGIAFQSAGDLTIEGDISLAQARYGDGAAGHLEFTSAGTTIINGQLSDGFASASRDAALLNGRSWSYAFAAGSDITLGEEAMIRTGTGDIRLDAGRDLVLTGNRSVIYTAGARTATAPGFTPVANRITGEFPTLGGDIAISAGRDVLAPITKQAAASWLFRYGDSEWSGDPDTSTISEQTSWSIIFKNYEQGIGALGGGNIDIAAGRDVSQLAVSLPTTGHMTTAVGGVSRAGDVIVRGGGDLTLTTGRDLRGGVFQLGEGEAVITAGGSIRPSDTLVEQAINPNFGEYRFDVVGALFALMDASASVTARGDVEIEAAFDPMAFQAATRENHRDPEPFNPIFTSFNSHTDRTAISLASITGDIVDRLNPFASTDLSRGTGARESVTSLQGGGGLGVLAAMRAYRARVPGTVHMAALQGDIALDPRFGRATTYLLSPTDTGTLEMLANGSLNLSFVQMLDKAAAYRRTALNPYTSRGTLPNLSTATNFERGFVPAHSGDRDPVRLYAMTGNASGRSRFVASLELPKALQIYAGLDVTISAGAQHNGLGEISSVVAGRDVRDGGFYLLGQGRMVIEAGRDVINFGAGSRGGGGVNLALPDIGADISIQAGTAGPVDYNGFAAAYLDPANGADVVRTYLPELGEYMKGLGFAALTDAAMVEAFAALPLSSRQPLLQQIYFTELKETGIDVNNPDSPRFQRYDRGYDAIKRLFTADPETIADELRGNVLLNNIPVETQAGGNITILAPYGEVAIGAPATSPTFDPNFSGVITRKGGDIRIMANGNIDLFTSRVFTLQGGDVTMWTSSGDITAGAGAKTGVVQPPLVYTISNDAVSTLNVFGLQTGSGIGVLDAGGTGSEDRRRSRLDLIAPRGEVNAGDAGIRVVGDLNIAALTVVGLDNIQVSGEATGLPEIVAVNVGALTTASATASAVTKAAEAVAQRERPVVRREVPSIITGRVLGFGEE